MSPSYFWMIVLVLSAEAAAAQSQERIMAPIPSTNAANVQIIGGKPATPADWPATLMFDGNLGRCTSTIVGTYVVLTAAHCVDDKSPAKLLWGNRRTDLLCHVHPDYRGRACANEIAPQKLVGCTADVAICIAAKPLSPDTARFERVRNNPPPVSAKDKIFLLGFGCTEADGKITEVLQEGSGRGRVAFAARRLEGPGPHDERVHQDGWRRGLSRRQRRS